MKTEKKYPRAIVGAFIFNEKDELFLMKTVQFHNKYNVPGGSVELGETIEEACIRETKEETNMDIEDLEFMGVSDGLNLNNKIYKKPENHLIFINYKARVKGEPKIKLNKEATDYKWRPVSEWLKNKNVSATVMGEIEKHLVDTKSFEHKYKQALADYQNLLKRTADEKQEFVRYANEQLILEMLPVYDNLKVSMEHIDETAKTNGWAEGIKYVIKQFGDILENLGVEEIETKGKNFDHNTMEAIEGKGEKVKKQAKPGYKLRGKVIVPARVILE